MKKILSLVTIVLLALGGWYLYTRYQIASQYGAPPYIAETETTPIYYGRYGDLSTWTRPEGPLRVGLQAGHWKNNELPDELERIRGNGGATSRSGVAEWEVNLKIAEATKMLLEEKGIVVDILPATIPPGYWADAFVSIHADGSLDGRTRGFKVAAPRRDVTGKASKLVEIIETVYAQHTQWEMDPNISRNMTGYYAFNWRRFEHSIHPMTTAVILETGFLTNPSDAAVLVNSPQIPAQAVADSLFKFLEVD